MMKTARFSALLVGLIVVASAAATSRSMMRSQYSPLGGRSCKTISRLEEGGETTVRCPGVMSYQLHLIDADARTTIDVVAPDGSVYPLDYWTVVSSRFSSVSAKAEWRVRSDGHVGAVTALIVRLTIDRRDANEKLPSSYLAVGSIKRHGACVIARVPAGARDNEIARTLADGGATKSCLKPL